MERLAKPVKVAQGSTRVRNQVLRSSSQYFFLLCKTSRGGEAVVSSVLAAV